MVVPKHTDLAAGRWLGNGTKQQRLGVYGEADAVPVNPARRRRLQKKNQVQR